ncbi:serine protease persephone-like [Eurosta solidaginis]|uniref:serine protease persephone-like n=1 Tax=Eurosta solidaginis TaxID=178769 RepID=UPI0035317615
MKGLVEIDIKTTYVYENYSTFSHHYDFGLIELIKDVEYTSKIYPTCLHTSATDLPDNTELIATGWGRHENECTTYPARLMSAYLNLITLTKCNLTYAKNKDRNLSNGIDLTQFCASASEKDACLGNSGGPIHLVIENDPCKTDHYKGICATSSNCPNLPNTMSTMGLSGNHVGRCGFTVVDEIICCPESALISTTPRSPTEFTTISSQGIRDMLNALPAHERKQKFKDLMREAEIGGRPNPSKSNAKLVRAADRPADRACREIEKNLMPSLIFHILGGDPVPSPTEYPHMVDIVYDNDVLKCGGSLIEKRFVLTAAHCLEVRGAKAIKVRLGVTDFNNTAQLASLVEIDIKTTYIHERYSSFSHYFDIGLIELVKDVTYTASVYPTCIYTNENDLPDNTELVVTGWGRTENENQPARLMAAYLNVIPVSKCDLSYASHRDRHLIHGIDETQICAFAPGKDACWGDSGGPLHFANDKSFNNYRVVGVVSFGLLCGSNAPGVYTRVTAYLDFIESIVWPEG